MSWSAHFGDPHRQRALRLIVLKGQERKLDHERSLLRRDLSVELQRRCRVGKTAAAIELEQKIRAAHAAWLAIIDEIRQVQKGAAA